MRPTDFIAVTSRTGHNPPATIGIVDSVAADGELTSEEVEATPLRIASGGQTGDDQAGWRAARRAGLPTGGWVPRGFETEDSPRPDFAREYGVFELDGGYPKRTQANARDSDAVAGASQREADALRSVTICSYLQVHQGQN